MACCVATHDFTLCCPPFSLSLSLPAQRSAQELPQVEKSSLTSCLVSGGDEMVITGSNFFPESKVIFLEKGPGNNFVCATAKPWTVFAKTVCVRSFTWWLTDFSQKPLWAKCVMSKPSSLNNCCSEMISLGNSLFTPPLPARPLQDTFH